MDLKLLLAFYRSVVGYSLHWRAQCVLHSRCRR